MMKVLTKVILTYPNPLWWALVASRAENVCRQDRISCAMDKDESILTFTIMPDGKRLEEIFTPKLVKYLSKKSVKVELIYSPS